MLERVNAPEDTFVPIVSVKVMLNLFVVLSPFQEKLNESKLVMFICVPFRILVKVIVELQPNERLISLDWFVELRYTASIVLLNLYSINPNELML